MSHKSNTTILWPLCRSACLRWQPG